MQIEINNTIKIDHETEVIHEVRDCQVTTKANSIYIVYHNDEKQRVVLKIKDDELIMTRYSDPKSIMRFHKGSLALVSIPTPMGIQHLITDTCLFEQKPEQNLVKVDYQLKQAETGQLFADYQLEIKWY